MSLNILPFQILYDGKLPNKNPFNQHVKKTNILKNSNEKTFNSTISKSFRGRRLNGSTIEISKSNHSIVIMPKNESGKNLDILLEKSLNEVTYWNYDDEVKEYDDIPQLINAVHYSNILHRET